LKLRAITAEIHVFEGAIDWAHPLRLRVSIHGRDSIRICEQRGDGISFDGRPLEPADLGEGGLVEVHDITDRLDPALRGSEIEAVRIIHDEEGRLVGLALARPDRDAFCIWVDDDEFRWGDEGALSAGSFREGDRPAIGPAL
jgi:hypothetical protein